jgi:hypothetical protein
MEGAVARIGAARTGVRCTSRMLRKRGSGRDANSCARGRRLPLQEA